MQNGRLVALVAAVAVAAIAGGGALAYREGPQTAAADAAPLSSSPSPAASTPTTPPTTTPKPKPTPPTTPTPTSTSTRPVKTKVDLEKLTSGRTPQVAYLTGRTIRGGAGNDVKVPGTGYIQAVARLNQSALAVVSKGGGTEMLTIDTEGTVTRRTPDVTHIVTADDGMTAAYVAVPVDDTGKALSGATIYAERATVQKVTVPGIWNVKLLGYINGKVYFDGSTREDASTSALYEWTPGAAKATAIKTVSRPTAVSGAGTAASLTTLTDYNSCTSILAMETGKRLWRTCDYQVDAFTPDSATAIAGPFYRDGYGDGIAAALDAKTGTLLHEWSGVFRQAIAEDDQHLLLLADDGEDTPASIIRCTVSTGACELATPLAKGQLLIGY